MDMHPAIVKFLYLISLYGFWIPISTSSKAPQKWTNDGYFTQIMSYKLLSYVS